jgi:2-hydroxycyclohexanecarboxyl-CoA dehydrogenase
VTGGAGGIGTAICRQLAAAGRTVAVADLSREAAEKVAADIDGIGVPLDVTDPDSVAAAVAETTERLGAPTIVINVAGWDELKPFLETDEDFTHKVLEINLNGPIRVLRATLPAMVEARYGRVVNIASDAGRVGSTGEVVYSGCKGATIAFSKALAREVARSNVTINTVCPGPTDTPAMDAFVGTGEQGQKIRDSMVRGVPLGRIGVPDDYPGLVAFLASDDAAFMTGQTISVSGGLSMHG